jgi:hypothetical protein
MYPDLDPGSDILQENLYKFCNFFLHIGPNRLRLHTGTVVHISIENLYNALKVLQQSHYTWHTLKIWFKGKDSD